MLLPTGTGSPADFSADPGGASVDLGVLQEQSTTGKRRPTVRKRRMSL
jgi:hypothetical protein